MKNKNSYKAFASGILILLAILVQSFHSINHLAEEFTRKRCDHQYASHKNTINHWHHNADSCFECAFAFTPAPANAIFSFTTATLAIEPALPFVANSGNTSYFEGSLFSYRGPPSIIV